MTLNNQKTSRFIKVSTKNVLLIALMFTFCGFVFAEDESTLQVVDFNKQKQDPGHEEGQKEATINKALSDAFNQEIQRNYQFLMKARFSNNTIIDAPAEPNTFLIKQEKQKTIISPILGFRYQLSPNLSLGAETELGYFKFTSDKWHDLDYSPPEDFFNVDNSLLIHTDASIKLQF